MASLLMFSCWLIEKMTFLFSHVLISFLPIILILDQTWLVSAANVITIEDDDDKDNDNHCIDKGGQIAVVDLEADDAGDNHPAQLEINSVHCRGDTRAKVMGKAKASQRMCMWYYIDPQGDEQGPFTMEHLRIWQKNGFFPDDFKVWRTGQTSNDAILLVDALQMAW